MAAAPLAAVPGGSAFATLYVSYPSSSPAPTHTVHTSPPGCRCMVIRPIRDRFIRRRWVLRSGGSMQRSPSMPSRPRSAKVGHLSRSTATSSRDDCRYSRSNLGEDRVRLRVCLLRLPHAACRSGILFDAVGHHHGEDGQIRQAPAGRRAVYPQMATDGLGGKGIAWVIRRNMAASTKTALCFAEPLAAWPPDRLRPTRETLWDWMRWIRPTRALESDVNINSRFFSRGGYHVNRHGPLWRHCAN